MSPPPPDLPFEEKHREIAAAAVAFQRALKAAIDEVFPHEFSARSLGRRLSIDKTLGWQVLQLATATDAPAMLAALPGERGVRKVIDALAAEGVSPEAIAAASASHTTLRRVFANQGTTPREILAIAAGGLDATTQDRHLAKMLQLHFDSTVAIRGEVANATAACWMVTPSRQDPSLATLVSLDMLDGFRTIRPLGPRLVHRGIGVDRSAQSTEWSRLDRMAGDVVFPSLIRNASTPDLGPEVLEAHETPGGILTLADPDRHETDTLTLSFGDLIEAIGPIHATPDQRSAELATKVAMPMRNLWFDVLLDETLPEVEPTAALYFSAMQGVEYGQHAELRRFTGRIDAGWSKTTSLPASSGVDPAWHRNMLEHGAALVDRPLDAFRCYRMHVAYPPSFTRATIRWPLPDRDDA